MLLALCALLLTSVALAQEQQLPTIGIICQEPDRITTAQWQAPDLLKPLCELLVLLEWPMVKIVALEGCDARITHAPESQAFVYRTPTWTEQAKDALLPYTLIELAAPARFGVRLAPEG